MIKDVDGDFLPLIRFRVFRQIDLRDVHEIILHVGKSAVKGPML